MSGAELVRLPFGLAPENYARPLLTIRRPDTGAAELLVNTGASEEQLDALPVHDSTRLTIAWRAIVLAGLLATWLTITLAVLHQIAPIVALAPMAVIGVAALAVLGLQELKMRRWRRDYTTALALLSPVLAKSPLTIGAGRRSLGSAIIASAPDELEEWDERQGWFEIAHQLREHAEHFGTPSESLGLSALLRAEASFAVLSAEDEDHAPILERLAA